MYEKEEIWRNQKEVDWKYCMDNKEEIIKENERKNKKIKGKKMVGVNDEYFVDHAEEIINDTEHFIFTGNIGEVMPESMVEKCPKLQYYVGYAIKFRETHKEMDYLWGFYARTLSDEEYGTWIDCVDRKYCEDTGRWDLFIWK